MEFNADLVWLCLASAAGGAVNAIAGGGTLLTFPALYAVVGPTNAVLANATSTVALLPGAVAAAVGYKREMVLARRWLAVLIGPSLLGGWIGARLLTSFPDRVFEQLVPWLILIATSLLALQPLIARWTGIGKPHENPTGRTVAGILCFQFLVGIYGGYFGAGIGILMLSALAMMGMADIHQMNALKSILGAAINGIAAAQFIVQQRVDWSLAIPMTVAALIGGYGAAIVARRLNRQLVRNVVIGIGFTLATWYFYNQWAKPRPEDSGEAPQPGVSSAAESPASENDSAGGTR